MPKKTESKPLANRKLYRSEKNRVVAGICGGLGEYFDLDPIIFRIIFVLMTFWGGSGLLIYLILWVLIPTASAAPGTPQEDVKKNAAEIKHQAEKFADNIRRSGGPQEMRLWLGFLLLGIGVLFLLANFGVVNPFNLARFWPLVLIAVGFVVLARGR